MPRLRKTFPRQAATPVSTKESKGGQSSITNSPRQAVAATSVARDQYWVMSVAMVTLEPAMPFLSRVGDDAPDDAGGEGVEDGFGCVVEYQRRVACSVMRKT